MNDSNNVFDITCKVICGNSNGSAFLIKNDLIVTAYHVITEYFEKNKKILIEFENGLEYEATPLTDLNTPVVVLKLSDKIDKLIRPFGGFELKENDSAKVYGFLSEKHSGDIVEVFVNRIINLTNEDIEFCNTLFIMHANDRIPDYSGLSGSPIMSNGNIVGMLIRQDKQAGIATRLRGICGVEFRKYLAQQGVEVEVSDSIKDTQQTAGTEQLALKHGDIQKTYEIDKLYNALFEPIRKARLSGDILKSQSALQSFFENLFESSASNEKKAEFYYAGAVWMLLDRHKEDAIKYLTLAKTNNSELDDRIYCGYDYLFQGKINEAKDILKPLDKIAVLNTYVTCMIEEKKDLSEIIAVIEATGLNYDTHTYHLLAVAALQADKFDEADIYVKKLQHVGINNPDVKILNALTNYWKAMVNLYEKLDRLGFMSGPNIPFYPTNNQKELLEKAYQILDSTYSDELIESNYNNALTVLWGLLIISTLLPGKDYLIWLDRFRKLERLHPLGILFSLNRGLKIPEDILNDYLSLKIPEKDQGMYAYTAMELYLEKAEIESAKKIFDQYKEAISLFQSKTVEECELNLLIQCKEFDKAKEILKKTKLLHEIRERYEIGIADLEDTKVINQLVSRAISYAKSSKKTMDFYNADIICKKYGKWKLAEGNAKRWWNETGEIVALECLAEVQYEQGRFSKSLKSINLAETHGDCSERIRACKLNCLASLAKYDEANSLLETFENVETNVKLVLARANIYIADGKKENAVQVLREFADKDLFDISLYTMLVNLLLTENKDLAYQYAYSLYNHDPENPDVIRLVGYIGIMTGHDDITEKYFSLMREEEKSGKNVRFVSIDEIREIIAEQRKHLNKINDMYLNLELPIHMIANEHNSTLGGLLYAENNKQGPCYGRFGRKTNDLKIDFSVPLVLDYTMCMTLYSLGVLEKICSLFKEVIVPYHFFPAIRNDIENLKNVQEHIEERDIKLSEQLKTLNPKLFPDCEYKEHYSKYAFSDVNELNCARKNNAFIISNGSSGSMLNLAVPDEWDNYYIDKNSFYAAMHSFSLITPEINAEQVSPKLVEKISPHCRIVLDDIVLSELSEINALDDVFTYFNVILPEDTIKSIHLTANQHRNRVAAVNHFEKMHKLLNDLKDNKKIRIMPYPKIDKDVPQLYAKLLYEVLWHSTKNECYIGIDDRYITQYEGFTNKAKTNQILTSYDLLSSLESMGIIDTNEYFRYIDQLLSSRYCFFIPKAKYLFSRLSLAKINQDGSVSEDGVLALIRQIVAYAFWPKGGLHEQPMSNGKYTEFRQYLAEMLVELRRCLSMIWKSNRSLEWKQATSDWLLCVFGDYIIDTSKDNEISKTNIPFKQSLLLLVAIEFSHDLLLQSQYINWITPYFMACWYANSGFIDMVAEHVLLSLESYRLPIDNKEIYSILITMKVNFLCALPERLLCKILEQPSGKKYLDIIYSRRPFCRFSSFEDNIDYSVPELNIDLVLSEDIEACENAILNAIANKNVFTEIILNELSEEKLYIMDNNLNYFITRFLSNLAWHSTVEKQNLINQKKRLLAVLLKEE